MASSSQLSSAFSSPGEFGTADHSIISEYSSSNPPNTAPGGSSSSSSSSAQNTSAQADSNETNVTSCKQCGSSELDSDPSRGDTVCMNCGYVLEESLIVSEVCFEEDGHGGASAIGQFVSSESKGGGGIGLSSGGGGGGSAGYHQGVAKESREITLRTAKRKITEVAQQLRLNQHCIDVSFNFFKMALHKQLTKGRKHPLTIAACIYMTCRIEGTPHLLIDFSDVVQMDIYALGRAYIHISRALFINIPAVDPCMYILRFAHKFDLGNKTHEVAMTASRLVQRMKRDWIHLGRRPSGLCGAALLIAARLHNFSRTVNDIIKVVKVHETTLRKRLVEFGETPSSSLTIEEFMSVDLEEEHDPPAFKNARIKDREHLQRLLSEEDLSTEMSELQVRIEEELVKKKTIRGVSRATVSFPEIANSVLTQSLIEGPEEATTAKFIIESTLSTINTLIPDSKPFVKLEGKNQKDVDEKAKKLELDRLLMPPPSPATMPTPHRIPAKIERKPDRNSLDEEMRNEDSESEDHHRESGELDISDIDDEEMNSYIMTDVEAERKRVMWERLNNDYIIAQEKKREQYEKDVLEGKYDKKKKNPSTKAAKEKSNSSSSTGVFQAKSAGEAIKIMLTERKVSSKINYEVLRKLALSVGGNDEDTDELAVKKLFDEDQDGMNSVTVIESGQVIQTNKRPFRIKSEKEVKDEPEEKKKKVIKEEKTLEARKDKELRTEPIASELIEDGAEVNEEEEDEVNENEEEEEVEDEEVDEEVVEESPVIVETGPVQYANVGSIPEEEHYDEDEENEEEYDDEVDDEVDNTHTLSARELLTKFRGDGDEDEQYDEDYY